MAWQYFFPSAKALETESNTQFDVKFGKKIECMDDFEISPVAGSKAKFTQQDLFRLKTEFWEAFVQSNIREDMRSIVNRNFAGDCHWVAYTLTDITKRKLSNRTVQAWLMEPGKPSSRTCPQWALEALKTFTANPENQEYLEQGRGMREQDSKSSRPVSTAVDSKHSVQYATNEILAEERRKNQWRQASFDTLPNMIHQFEKDMEREITAMRNSLVSIELALRNATSFEEFKFNALEAISDREVAQFLVRDARRAIEGHSDEFATDDGVAKE